MPDYGLGAYSRGLQGAASSISATNQRLNMRDSIRAQKEQFNAEQAAKAKEAQITAWRTTRDSLMEQSFDVFNKITDAAAEAEKTGELTDAERTQFREAANGALIATITTLQQDWAMAMRAGATPDDPVVQEIQRSQQMLASHAPVFDARMAAARTSAENPTILGQRKGREQAAQVRELSAELGLDETVVAEGLGFIPGQPAPTEMEKLERSLRLLDREGVPDDDPRRLRVLGRLTSMTTPSVADIIAPMIAKKARGEKLTTEEQAALDAAQRMSFTDQLMRGLLGGGAGGTPQYEIDEETGNLVAK